MITMTCGDVAGAIGAKLPHALREERVLRVSTDSRYNRLGDGFFAICGDRFDGHRFVKDALAGGATACVCAHSRREMMNLSPEQSRSCLWVDDTIKALGKLAAFYRRRVLPPPTNIIAVTGSNGKTTTKCMIDHVLSGSLKGVSAPKNYNNHIGVPLTLFSADGGDRFVVVEIGTNSPGEVSNLASIASPNVAVVTSIGEAHLEGLGDINAVAEEKASLLDHLQLSGLAVVNVDRLEILPRLEREIRGKLLTVGARTWARLSVGQRTSTIRGSRFLLDGRFPVELPIPGTHHATNAAAAFAVGRWFGLDPAEIIERLATFTPPQGRTLCVEVGGITLVDDTYNANPASMRAAIDTLCCQRKGRRIFVMGDMLELGVAAPDLHRDVVEMARDVGIEVLVAVGPQMCEAARAVCEAASGIEVWFCDDAAAAGEVVTRLLENGDTVLLKGSRGIELDRVVRRLKEEAGRRAAVA